MGRYYTGDIEGKFWFGVQCSDDASFFGGSEEEVYFEDEDEIPYELQYFFQTGDLEDIKHGIEECIIHLGEYKMRLDDFFAQRDSYNDQMIVEAFEIPKEKVWELLVWYARLGLGVKIKGCVEEKGECSFSAEL
jgi:hypothetical protein